MGLKSSFKDKYTTSPLSDKYELITRMKNMFFLCNSVILLMIMMAFREVGFINSEPTLAECLNLHLDNMFDSDEIVENILRGDVATGTSSALHKYEDEKGLFKFRNVSIIPSQSKSIQNGQNYFPMSYQSTQLDQTKQISTASFLQDNCFDNNTISTVEQSYYLYDAICDADSHKMASVLSKDRLSESHQRSLNLETSFSEVKPFPTNVLLPDIVEPFLIDLSSTVSLLNNPNMTGIPSLTKAEMFANFDTDGKEQLPNQAKDELRVAAWFQEENLSKLVEKKCK